MKEVIKWIIENKTLVAEIGLAIFSLVLFLVKKKPVKILDFAKTVILNSLPLLIQRAEDTIHGNKVGKEKKEYVLYLLEEYLKKEFPEINFEEYKVFTSNAIEEILKTPQRKENN